MGLDLSGQRKVSHEPKTLKDSQAGQGSLRKWHFDNLGRKLDLSADLLGVNPYQASFHRGDLHGANLSKANLSEIGFSEADFHGANILGANLSEANLHRDDLADTDLTIAKLNNADLSGALLSRANFNLADLSNANLGSANIRQANLGRGLQPTIKFTVRHEEQKSGALEAITQGYDVTNARLQGANEAYLQVIDRLIGRPNDASVSVGAYSTVAIGPGASINIQEYIQHLEEIKETIKSASEEILTETEKQGMLEIIGDAGMNVAKVKVKEAVEVICQLGIKNVSQIIDNPGFQFFKNLLDQGM